VLLGKTKHIRFLVLLIPIYVQNMKEIDFSTSAAECSMFSGSRWLRTERNWVTDREQFIRLNATTARPLILERLAKIWTCDWLNTNEWLEMVISTITLLNTIYKQTTELTGTLLNALPTYSTDYYQWITLKNWFTNLEQTPLRHCQQLPARYRRLIDNNTKTNSRQTD